MTPKDIKVLHRACQPADRGISRFVLPTLWELITDTSEEIPLRSAMTVRLDQLEDSPRFRCGQVAGALYALKEVLEKTSHESTGEEAVSLQVGTVMVLAHVLLKHQA